MELKIISPQEGGFVKEIQWNNEELKAEISEKMQDYKNLVFTEETIKEAKKDRANLNKLKNAFEDERKRIKRQCMAPYERFEAQVKELIGLIEEPIRLIDAQIKEVEEQKRQEKRKGIEELFGSIGFQNFVTLDMVFDEKWLNASVPMSRIEEQMKSRMYEIGNGIMTIRNLPEFSFEAMEVYKKTLDLTQAIQEGRRLSEIQKKKAAYEEEQWRKAEEEKARKQEEEAEKASVNQQEEKQPEAVEEREEPIDQPEKIVRLDFRVWGTREQLLALRNYMKDNHLKFGKVDEILAVQNSLAARQTKTGLTAYLTQDAFKKQINSVVGGKNGTRFISSIVSAVQVTPALQECTNPSILSAALLGEALNLSPSPQLGQFYMVPFDNKKKGVKEAQFQLGYKGYIQLAERSGYYKKLNVLAIKEGELIQYDPLNEEIEVELIEDDVIREETPAMGYYAMFEYENGFRKTMYWSKKKMLAHAEKYSQAFKRNGGAKSLELLEQGKIPEKDMWKYSSFWFKDFDGMAMKTMLRQLISKWGIMSIDLQTAVDKDMAVIHEDGSAEFVENEPEAEDTVVSDQELNEVPAEQPEEKAGSDVEDEFFNN